MRPWASTRTSPRLLLATAMVAADVGLDGLAGGDAVALRPPPLPHAAVTSVSEARIVPATTVCLRPVTLFLLLWRDGFTGCGRCRRGFGEEPVDIGGVQVLKKLGTFDVQVGQVA